MKKKKGAQPGLDSEEWVTMLDNAIAENENIQMGEGAIEEAPKELYTVPTQSLAIPQIMKVSWHNSSFVFFEQPSIKGLQRNV